MKTKLIFSILALVLFTACKKKTKALEKVIISGTIYKDCFSIAQNSTYYRIYPFTHDQSEELITNSNGEFSFEVDKYFDGTVYISNNPTYNKNYFCIISGNGSGENMNVGILRENASNQLVLKLKTNHVLTNLDTINFAFQYNLVREKIYGPITRDTIIGYYNKAVNVYTYNNNSSVGELKILWWGFGQPTPTNQVQVDYTIHGCAGVADTAYIVVP